MKVVSEVYYLNKMKKKTEKHPDKKVFSFFVLAFPTILIVCFGLLLPNTSWVALIKILLAMYQFVMLKQFLDDYYAFAD